MKSRIMLNLEDFIRILSPADKDKVIYEIDRRNVELDETHLRGAASHWAELLGTFAGPVAHKPKEWRIEKDDKYLPPGLSVVYGGHAYLVYQFKAKDVPDARDRTASVSLLSSPAPSHGNLVKYAIQVVLEEIHLLTTAQAAMGDSFASSWRLDMTSPRYRAVEYNPFNQGDVGRAFKTMLKEWL